MGMPSEPWRDALVPASFRGAPFYVETDSQVGGRRTVTHEIPMADTPYTEDMGRRAHRWTIQAYVLGPDYVSQMQGLIAALDQQGAGSLQHPTLGTVQACAEEYHTEERRDKGGWCAFSMSFVEAGALNGNGVTQNTSSTAQASGQALGQSSANGLDDGTITSLKGGGVIST